MMRYSVNVIVLCQMLTCLCCLNRKAFLASCSQALTFFALAPIRTHTKVKLLVLLSAGCKENKFSGLLFEHSATMLPTSLKLILINLHTQFTCSWCKWRTESTRPTEKSSCSRLLETTCRNTRLVSQNQKVFWYWEFIFPLRLIMMFTQAVFMDVDLSRMYKSQSPSEGAWGNVVLLKWLLENSGVTSSEVPSSNNIVTVLS